MVCKVTISIGSKRELIEPIEFLYNWLVNPIDVITLLMRGRPQAEAGHASFIQGPFRQPKNLLQISMRLQQTGAVPQKIEKVLFFAPQQSAAAACIFCLI